MSKLVGHPELDEILTLQPTGALTLGVVAIGRNEGRHLQRCLASAVCEGTLVVYVDSGSTDDSLSIARQRGVEVVQLDMRTPFSAARARNAGFQRLLQIVPSIHLVQFVDGDCELAPGWLDRARTELAGDPTLGAVFGQRQELHPEASVYNLVCDLEWDTPLGPSSAFGGDVMIRVEAMQQTGGYNPAVIASEDRELWMRMQRAHWKTNRIDARMTLHDARITRFGQWWKRSERLGHACGQLCSLHSGPSGDRHHAKAQRRALIWGLMLPLAILASAWPTQGLSLLCVSLYVVVLLRAKAHGKARGWSNRESWAFAWLCLLGRLPEAIGVLRWHTRRLFGFAPTLIEYKGPEAKPANRAGLAPERDAP